MTTATAAAAAERVVGRLAAAATGGAWRVTACDADFLHLYWFPVRLLF